MKLVIVDRWAALALTVAAACATSVLADPGSVAAASLTTIVTFNGQGGVIAGSNPHCTLIADGSGNLFGTTLNGGPSNDGTVFEIAAGTHAISTLVNFDGTNGYNPNAGVYADAAGNLFGTTKYGGSGSGNVFEIPAGTSSPITLATFDGTNGSLPLAGLTSDAAGDLYGSTYTGGSSGGGTVFELAAGSHAFSTVANLGSNGQSLFAGVIVDAAGNIYGTAAQGGPYGNGYGGVYESAAGTHAYSFFPNPNGAYPEGGLVADSAGNLYGTMSAGGAGGGTVFKFTPSTGAYTTLASFGNGGTGPTGPVANLIIDDAGNLFGTSEFGGVDGDGTVFEVAAGTNDVSTLASFDGADGENPVGGLYADAEGNLYGTTSSGGSSNGGTVFELTTTGFVVPEPASLSLLATVGLTLSLRRHRACS